MDFDQISINEERGDLRPETKQEAFQIPFSDIAQSDPDHLGRRSFKHQAVEEVGIPGENRRIPGSGMFPKLAIRHLLAKIGGMGAIQRKDGREGRWQIFVNQQVVHEASWMVERAELSRRA